MVKNVDDLRNFQSFTRKGKKTYFNILEQLKVLFSVNILTLQYIGMSTKGLLWKVLFKSKLLKKNLIIFEISKVKGI